MTVLNAVLQSDKQLSFEASDVAVNQGEAFSSLVRLKLPVSFANDKVRLLFRRSDGKVFASRWLKPYKKGNVLQTVFVLDNRMTECSGPLMIQAVLRNGNKIVKSVYGYRASVYIKPSICVNAV